MELPEKIAKFKSKLQSIYINPELFEKTLTNLKPKPIVFRLNTLRENHQQTLEKLKSMGFDFKPGPILNSYILLNTPQNTDIKTRLSDTQYFKDGSLYIQNLSSMLPALELKPKPGEKILDMCASPGSKTSQMALLGQNQALITAVENNRARYFSMIKNMETQSVENVEFLLDNAYLLDKKYPKFQRYFDKVLLDAPCSNEGLLNLDDAGSFEKWNPKTPEHLSRLQKKLISGGLNMLKVGGILVYSTCTFSVEENEEVIDWALKKFPKTKLLECGVVKSLSKTTCGLTSYKKKTFSGELAKSVRILPTDIYNGFFIAVICR